MPYDSRRFRDYFDHQFTYEAGFRRNVRRYRRHTAFLDPVTGVELDYEGLAAEVDKTAAALAARGVGRGDRVVYQLFNGLEFALLYLATQRLGAVGVPINFRLAPGETSLVLDDSAPKVFVFDLQLAEAARKAVEASTVTPGILTVGAEGEGATRRAGEEDFGEAIATAHVADLPPYDPAGTIYDETTRLYTSGTTGRPKGVSLPSIVEVMSAHDVIMHFPLTPYDRTLNMTPWFHRGGLYSGGPNPVFYIGGSVVPMRAFNPGTALDWVSEHNITFLIGAPTTLEMLADEQERQPRDLGPLRGIVTMGAPLDRAAVLRYQDVLTPRIFNGYGTTETFWNTFLRPEDLPEHAGSAGRASTDDDVAVVKVFEDRRAHPHELAARDNTEAGEIIMRSPKSGFSYANMPEKDEEKFFEGWHYTGDLGVWDEEDFVTVLGRKDDMIISGGENVHPVQVEETLMRHPGVKDALVVGLPDEHWGQRVVAYIVGRGEPVTPSELDAWCVADEEMANFKRPRAYRFVTELPMTATGKKVHYLMSRQAVEDHEQGLFESPGNG